MSYFLGYPSEESRSRKEAMNQRLITVSKEDFQKGVDIGEVEDSADYVSRYFYPALSSPRRRRRSSPRRNGADEEEEETMKIPAGLNPSLEKKGTVRVLLVTWDHEKTNLCGRNTFKNCYYPDFVEKIIKYIFDVNPDIFFFAGQRVGLEHEDFVALLEERLRDKYNLLLQFYGPDATEDMASVVFSKKDRQFAVLGKTSKKVPFRHHLISLLVPYRAAETAELLLYNVENKAGGILNNYINKYLSASQVEKYLEEDSVKVSFSKISRPRVVLVAGDLAARAAKSYMESGEAIAPRSTELDRYYRRDTLATERRWRENRMYFKEGPEGLGPFFMPTCPLETDRGKKPSAKDAAQTGKRMNLRDYEFSKEETTPSWCSRILYSSFAPPPPVHVREYNVFDFGDAMYASSKAAIVGVFDLDL